MTSQYKQEQRVFRRLKKDCTENAKQQYEQAVSEVLGSYNTTIYENRFVVGGAVEVFTYALLRTVGIDCSLYGDQATSGDILLPNGRILSVKGTFTGGPSNIKLVNKLGGGHRPWTAATLFVVSGVGIVFGAPDMVAPEHVRDVKDGTELSKAGLQTLINNPANVLGMRIATKPPTEVTGFSQKASTAVALKVLSDLNLDILLEKAPANGASGE